MHPIIYDVPKAPPTELLDPVLTTDAGTGAKPWLVQLSPWPIWGQLVDWTADSQPDENKTHNCLPESMAECIKYVSGIELPADYIKDVEYGEAYIGDTTFDKAAWFLERYCESPCIAWSTQDNRRTLYHVWDALVHGYPCVGLFQYGGVAGGANHCMPYVYLTADTIKVSDPWSASLITWDYPTHDAWSLYAGLTVKRLRRL